MEQIKDYIRNIPDFPKPGIQFKDITPLVKHPKILNMAVDELIKPYRDENISYVAGMEARGFIFGSLAANALGTGFIP